jgi:hypothetical protein
MGMTPAGKGETTVKSDDGLNRIEFPAKLTQHHRTINYP